ncbi:MAG: sigma-54-dependent Fis family transcriptional regulator [Thermodesulfovibrionales bacterium]|nr:sigma-54-dependent Fis family transcriptional regulator [Thermodesulfovibrionales bacterium]
MDAPLSGVRVIIIDPDPGFISQVRDDLEGLGAEVLEARDTSEAERYYSGGGTSALLANVNLIGVDAESFILNYKGANPEGMFFLVLEPGVSVTSDDPSALSVEDYLQKPIDTGRLAHMLESGSSRALALPDPIVNQARPYFQFRSQAMRMALAQLPKIAGSDQTVLISGETGTGKEIISRAIHVLSPRASGPFVAINCGAIPETLIESELFGHVKGAFTGAHKDRKGKFELARRGTLLLDEIGDMPIQLQVRLLRVLEEGQVFRVGSEEPIPVDVRIIASSLQDLYKSVNEGLFREDLYYRLNILNIHLPPLRQRVEDISLLAVHFMDRALAELGSLEPHPKLSTATTGLLEGLPWRGNVRELRNVITRVATFLPHSARQVLPMHVIPHLEGRYDSNMHMKETEGTASNGGIYIPGGTTLDEAKDMLIQNALERSGGNRTHAARMLDIGIRTLRRKVNK